MFTIVVIAGILVAIYFLFGRDDGTTTASAPATTTTAVWVPPPVAAPSECGTRHGWLLDDADRYHAAADALGEARQRYDSDPTNRSHGEYIREYGRALDLWLRYEADTEALLADCWDELGSFTIDAHRDYVADHRAWWHGMRSQCRGSRAVYEDIGLVDPWAAAGVSC